MSKEDEAAVSIGPARAEPVEKTENVDLPMEEPVNSEKQAAGEEEPPKDSSCQLLENLMLDDLHTLLPTEEEENSLELVALSRGARSEEPVTGSGVKEEHPRFAEEEEPDNRALVRSSSSSVKMTSSKIECPVSPPGGIHSRRPKLSEKDGPKFGNFSNMGPLGAMGAMTDSIPEEDTLNSPDPFREDTVSKKVFGGLFRPLKDGAESQHRAPAPSGPLREGSDSSSLVVASRVFSKTQPSVAVEQPQPSAGFSKSDEAKKEHSSGDETQFSFSEENGSATSSSATTADTTHGSSHHGFSHTRRRSQTALSEESVLSALSRLRGLSDEDFFSLVPPMTQSTSARDDNNIHQKASAAAKRKVLRPQEVEPPVVEKPTADSYVVDGFLSQVSQASTACTTCDTQVVEKPTRSVVAAPAKVQNVQYHEKELIPASTVSSASENSKHSFKGITAVREKLGVEEGSSFLERVKRSSISERIAQRINRPAPLDLVETIIAGSAFGESPDVGNNGAKESGGKKTENLLSSTKEGPKRRPHVVNLTKRRDGPVMELLPPPAATRACPPLPKSPAWTLEKAAEKLLATQLERRKAEEEKSAASMLLKRKCKGINSFSEENIFSEEHKTEPIFSYFHHKFSKRIPLKSRKSSNTAPERSSSLRSASEEGSSEKKVNLLNFQPSYDSFFEVITDPQLLQNAREWREDFSFAEVNFSLLSQELSSAPAGNNNKWPHNLHVFFVADGDNICKSSPCRDIDDPQEGELQRQLSDSETNPFVDTTSPLQSVPEKVAEVTIQDLEIFEKRLSRLLEPPLPGGGKDLEDIFQREGTALFKKLPALLDAEREWQRERHEFEKNNMEEERDSSVKTEEWLRWVLTQLHRKKQDLIERESREALTFFLRIVVDKFVLADVVPQSVDDEGVYMNNGEDDGAAQEPVPGACLRTRERVNTQDDPYVQNFDVNTDVNSEADNFSLCRQVSESSEAPTKENSYDKRGTTERLEEEEEGLLTIIRAEQPTEDPRRTEEGSSKTGGLGSHTVASFTERFKKDLVAVVVPDLKVLDIFTSGGLAYHVPSRAAAAEQKLFETRAELEKLLAGAPPEDTPEGQGHLAGPEKTQLARYYAVKNLKTQEALILRDQAMYGLVRFEKLRYFGFGLENVAGAADSFFAGGSSETAYFPRFADALGSFEMIGRPFREASLNDFAARPGSSSGRPQVLIGDLPRARWGPSLPTSSGGAYWDPATGEQAMEKVQNLKNRLRIGKQQLVVLDLFAGSSSIDFRTSLDDHVIEHEVPVLRPGRILQHARRPNIDNTEQQFEILKMTTAALLRTLAETCAQWLILEENLMVVFLIPEKFSKIFAKYFDPALEKMAIEVAARDNRPHRVAILKQDASRERMFLEPFDNNAMEATAAVRRYLLEHPRLELVIHSGASPHYIALAAAASKNQIVLPLTQTGYLQARQASGLVPHIMGFLDYQAAASIFKTTPGSEPLEASDSLSESAGGRITIPENRSLERKYGVLFFQQSLPEEPAARSAVSQPDAGSNNLQEPANLAGHLVCPDGADTELPCSKEGRQTRTASKISKISKTTTCYTDSTRVPSSPHIPSILGLSQDALNALSVDDGRDSDLDDGRNNLEDVHLKDPQRSVGDASRRHEEGFVGWEDRMSLLWGPTRNRQGSRCSSTLTVSRTSAGDVMSRAEELSKAEGSVNLEGPREKGVVQQAFADGKLGESEFSQQLARNCPEEQPPEAPVLRCAPEPTHIEEPLTELSLPRGRCADEPEEEIAAEQAPPKSSDAQAELSLERGGRQISRGRSDTGASMAVTMGGSCSRRSSLANTIAEKEDPFLQHHTALLSSSKKGQNPPSQVGGPLEASTGANALLEQLAEDEEVIEKEDDDNRSQSTEPGQWEDGLISALDRRIQDLSRNGGRGGGNNSISSSGTPTQRPTQRDGRVGSTKSSISSSLTQLGWIPAPGRSKKYPFGPRTPHYRDSRPAAGKSGPWGPLTRQLQLAPEPDAASGMRIPNSAAPNINYFRKNDDETQVPETLLRRRSSRILREKEQLALTPQDKVSQPAEEPHQRFLFPEEDSSSSCRRMTTPDDDDHQQNAIFVNLKPKPAWSLAVNEDLELPGLAFVNKALAHSERRYNFSQSSLLDQLHQASILDEHSKILSNLMQEKNVFTNFKQDWQDVLRESGKYTLDLSVAFVNAGASRQLLEKVHGGILHEEEVFRFLFMRAKLRSSQSSFSSSPRGRSEILAFNWGRFRRGVHFRSRY